MRVTPTPKLAWALGILYAPIFIALLIGFGGDYDEIGNSADNFFSAVVIPMGILTVAIVALTTWLGWWRPVISDDRPTPRWMLAVPIVMAIGIAGSIAVDLGRTSDLDTSFLLWLTIGTLLIGFCEEMVYRGLTIVGFRSGHREVRVWLFTTLLFAVLHLWNLAAGQGLMGTIQQFGYTFVLGSVYYVIRRSTGTILIPILIHAGWDWTGFASGSEAFSSEAAASSASDGAGSGVAIFAAVIAVILCLIGARKLFTDETPSVMANATA
ncbi:MAG: hypothetical protein DRJ50_04330 [Actinobacteria bacterium]|nr:MAG: hypothetical protein DRJ50_04330 [Actinomycetota bacterium]